MFQTPMLQLTPYLFAKAEYRNPTGSVKDRTAWYLLQDAQARGLLSPGSTVIEPTSGNLGISLAALCRQQGYRCILVMPAGMSPQRQQRMVAYGAEVVLTPAKAGMAGAVARARELVDQIPDSFLPAQFENPANPLAHVSTTGPEIWAQTQGQVDILVAGVGTGGTITGAGRFLKAQNPGIRIVAVEPAASPLLSEGWAGSHGIQGIGANFLPRNLDIDLLDEVCTVTDADALSQARLLGTTGIPAGLSAGANVHAAHTLSARYPGRRIVTILPDHADRYDTFGP